MNYCTQINLNGWSMNVWSPQLIHKWYTMFCSVNINYQCFQFHAMILIFQPDTFNLFIQNMSAYDGTERKMWEIINIYLNLCSISMYDQPIWISNIEQIDWLPVTNRFVPIFHSIIYYIAYLNAMELKNYSWFSVINLIVSLICRGIAWNFNN